MEKKIFIEVGYYEITARYKREDDDLEMYHGVGGLFTDRYNEFDTLSEFFTHLEKYDFQDHVNVGLELEDQYLEEFGEFLTHVFQWVDLNAKK